MKKLFLVCAALCSAFLQASVVTNLQPGLTLVQYDNKYVIQFSMPEYEIGEDTIVANNIEYIFSSIKPYNDYFDHMDEDGRPTLPFYTLHLSLPSTGTWSVTNVQTTELELLDYDYTPAQTHSMSLDLCSYDANYYNSYDDHWCWDDYEAHETTYRRHRGLSFTFFPCHYEPSAHELTIVTNATYEISYSNSLLVSYADSIASSDRLSWNLFDNIITPPISEMPPIDGDEYLIIADDAFASELVLDTFVTHKERLGYNVTVAQTCDIGNTAENIRTYIKEQYHSNDVQYVLLIGNYDKIPFSAGTEQDNDNPPTDVYYAALDESTISQQDCDITPDLYVGRWPVQSLEQLEYIIHKSMASDTTLYNHDPSKVSIFTGSGNGEDYSYRNGKYLYERIVDDLTGYSGALYDGRASGINCYTMKNELEGNNDHFPWMFVYMGHGSSEFLGAPYYVGYQHFRDTAIDMSSADYLPFGFAFSCLVGNIYDDENFARYWLGSYSGGVTFYAATTESYQEPNKYMSRKIFNQLENRPIVTIGEFVANGAAKYYNAFPVVWRRREMKKYILYGDPSLYIFGLDYHYHIPMLNPQRAENHSQTSESLLQKDGFLHINENQFPELQSVNIYSMTGQLLQSGNGYEINLAGLASGMYIAVIKTNNQQYSQQIVVK